MLPLAQLPEPLPELRLESAIQGEQLQIGSQELQSTWHWEGRRDQPPQKLWLPLDLLESQLGFRRFEGQLEWFGQRQPLDQLPQRTLGDELGLEVAYWLAQAGISLHLKGRQLLLSLPSAGLQRLRRGKGSTADRLVLDLDGPALVQRVGDDLHLGLRSTASQRRELQRLRLAPQQRTDSLVLRGQATRLRTLCLAEPWRVVLDGVRAGTPTPAAAVLPLSNPAIARWLRRGLVLEERTVTVGVKPLRVLRTGGELQRIGLTLKPLTMAG